MKKNVKTQFFGLIFFNRLVRFIPLLKSGINSPIPARQGIGYSSNVSSKTFSASFNKHPKNTVRKAFLLQLCNTNAYAIQPFMAQTCKP